MSVRYRAKIIADDPDGSIGVFDTAQGQWVKTNSGRRYEVWSADAAEWVAARLNGAAR